MFVVGTVLYRNLGSFLALQRWVSWIAWVPMGGQEEAGGLDMVVTGGVGQSTPLGLGAGLQGWLSAIPCL